MRNSLFFLFALLCCCGTSTIPSADAGGTAPADGSVRRTDGAPVDAGSFDAGPLDASVTTPRDAGPRGDAGDGTGPPPRAPGVPCGGFTCGEETPVCFACPHRDPMMTDAHCQATTVGTGAFFDHGCDFPAVFAQCDGPEDCAAGERCSFGGGEWGTTSCQPVPAGGGAAGFGWACHDDADCDPGLRCVEGDRLGYFAELSATTGWTPFVCESAF